MTDEEICGSFRGAKSPEKQLEIISQLALIPPEEVADILKRCGYDPPQRKPPKKKAAKSKVSWGILASSAKTGVPARKMAAGSYMIGVAVHKKGSRDEDGITILCTKCHGIVYAVAFAPGSEVCIKIPQRCPYCGGNSEDGKGGKT